MNPILEEINGQLQMLNEAEITNLNQLRGHAWNTLYQSAPEVANKKKTLNKSYKVTLSGTTKDNKPIEKVYVGKTQQPKDVTDFFSGRLTQIPLTNNVNDAAVFPQDTVNQIKKAFTISNPTRDQNITKLLKLPDQGTYKVDSEEIQQQLQGGNLTLSDLSKTDVLKLYISAIVKGDVGRWGTRFVNDVSAAGINNIEAALQTADPCFKCLFTSNESGQKTLIDAFVTGRSYPLYLNSYLTAAIVSFCRNKGGKNYLQKYDNLVKFDVLSETNLLQAGSSTLAYASNLGFDKPGSGAEDLLHYTQEVNIFHMLYTKDVYTFSPRVRKYPQETATFVCFAQDDEEMSNEMKSYLAGEEGADLPKNLHKYSAEECARNLPRPFQEFESLSDTLIFAEEDEVQPNIKLSFNDLEYDVNLAWKDDNTAETTSQVKFGNNLPKGTKFTVNYTDNNRRLPLNNSINYLPSDLMKRVSDEETELLTEWDKEKPIWVAVRVAPGKEGGSVVDLVGFYDSKEAMERHNPVHLNTNDQGKEGEGQPEGKTAPASEKEAQQELADNSEPVNADATEVNNFIQNQLLVDVTDKVLDPTPVIGADGQKWYKPKQGGGKDEELHRYDIVQYPGNTSYTRVLKAKDLNTKKGFAALSFPEGTKIYRWNNNVVKQINDLGFNLNPGAALKNGIQAEAFMNDLGLFRNDIND